MGIAALALHWGILTLFAAHIIGCVGGVTISAGWVHTFHWVGLVAGMVTLYGASLALIRRIIVPELRATSQVDDYLVLVLLIPILATGLYPVVSDKTFGISYTVAPWVRDVLTLDPQLRAMAGVATITKVHIVLSMAFFAYFPFTKMVHVWTVPLRYLVRPYQSIRSYQRAMS